MNQLLLNSIEILTNQHLSSTNKNEFNKLLREMFFNKNSILAEEGKHCKHIYFIEKGACYSYLINIKGDKQVVQFALEGHWISNAYSFYWSRFAHEWDRG